MIFMSESLRLSSSAYYNEIGNRVGSIICDNFQLEVAMYVQLLDCYAMQYNIIYNPVNFGLATCFVICVCMRKMKIENRSIYFGHFITVAQ